MMLCLSMQVAPHLIHSLVSLLLPLLFSTLVYTEPLQF